MLALPAEHKRMVIAPGNSLSNAILLWTRGTAQASLVGGPVQQRSTAALQASHPIYPHMPQNRHGWRFVRAGALPWHAAQWQSTVRCQERAALQEQAACTRGWSSKTV